MTSIVDPHSGGNSTLAALHVYVCWWVMVLAGKSQIWHGCVIWFPFPELKMPLPLLYGGFSSWPYVSLLCISTMTLVWVLYLPHLLNQSKDDHVWHHEVMLGPCLTKTNLEVFGLPCTISQVDSSTVHYIQCYVQTMCFG